MAMSEFSKAFASARKAGEKEFTFNGKRYNTKTADDISAEKKKALESDLRGKSDMIVALTKAERDAADGTSPEARKKISEAKRSAIESYKNRDIEEGMKSYGTRAGSRANSPAAPKATVSRAAPKKPYMPEEPDTGYAKGGSVRGYGAARGAKKCKII